MSKKRKSKLKTQPTRPSAVKPGPGRLSRELDLKVVNRGLQRDWMQRFSGLTEAFDETLAWADGLGSTPGLDPELEHLCRYIHDTIATGVDQILSIPDPHEVESPRLLLETEYLMRDFAEDPAQLSRWVSIAPHERPRAFGFGELRKRYETRTQIPEGMVSPVREHYRGHSRHSHPFPRSDVMPAAKDPQMGLLSDLGDLFFHACSCLSVAEAVVRAATGRTTVAVKRVNHELLAEIGKRLNTTLNNHIPTSELEALHQPLDIRQTTPRFWDSE